MHNETPATPSGSVWLDRQVSLGALGLLAVMLGGGWDIAWHIDIGRESFWSPPHLAMYSGITLILVSMGLALFQGWRQGHGNPSSASVLSMRLPSGIRANPGTFMAGVGALMSLTSAPIDELWHRSFGLDVTIWSPPHLQLIFGLVLTALGLAAAIASTLNHTQPERLRPPLPSIGTRRRGWGLHLLAAFFVLLLEGVLDEYHFDIPQYSLAYYPILLAPITVGSLMAGARAAGWRWSATAIGLLAMAVELLLKMELYLVGLGHVRLFFIFVPVAGLVIDLLWSRFHQAYRLWVIVYIGAAATTVYVPFQLAAMGWLDQLPWYIYLITLITGVLGALIGGRIGMALRPGMEPERLAEFARRTASQGGLPLAAVALMLSSHLLAPWHHGEAPPRVEVQVSEREVVAGKPVQIELRIDPRDALAEGGQVILSLARAGNRLRPELQGAQAPGIYRTSATLPSPGQWVMLVVLETAHGRWLDWIWLQVAAESGRGANNPGHYALTLEPPRTLPPDEIPQGWLRLGKAMVTAWILLLTWVSFAGLRQIEQDSLYLAAQKQ